jgi:hypothetical protein
MRLGALATSPMRASISTLVPERLRLMDLMDLSGTGQAACRVDGSAEPAATITYMTDYDKHKRKARIPFPSGTRGFLYCHVTDSAHPVANEIRFRVVPENSKAADTQALFARGGDLLVSPGVPWSIRAIKIARSRTLYASLATLLLRDNLVSREAMNHWEQLKGTHLYDHTPVLCHLDQPFAHNLSEGQHIMYVADKLDLYHVRLGPWTNDHRRAGTAYPRASPYTGMHRVPSPCPSAEARIYRLGPLLLRAWRVRGRQQFCCTCARSKDAFTPRAQGSLVRRSRAQAEGRRPPTQCCWNACASPDDGRSVCPCNPSAECRDAGFIGSFIHAEAQTGLFERHVACRLASSS